MKIDTSDVHFCLDNYICSQTDRVAMSSPFGPTLVNILWVENNLNWLKSCYYKFFT